MKFDENPFAVLQVSLYDTNTTIVERAEDLAFADPDNEKTIERAKDILLNPRKRIAAEVLLLVDANNFSAKNIFAELVAIDKKFSALNVEKIRGQINAARTQSKFPAVNDTNAIKNELKNLRHEIHAKVQDCFESMSHGARIKLANELADYCERANGGVIIDDFFDGYKLEMTAFIDGTTTQILSLLPKIKSDANGKFLAELTVKLTAFVNAQSPLDKFHAALGTNKFDDSEEIFYAVRSTAIDLFNEKHLIDEPLIITRLLAKNFSYLPPLAEMIRKDVKFLEEAEARRPTQAFLRSKAEFEEIIAAIDRELHFENGFEQANLRFYHEQFKRHCEDKFQSISKRAYFKADEWKYLNALAATIYIRVGNALTWTAYADLALELFRKALPYAEASGDVELIALVKKRVDEWSKLADNYSSNGGCFWIWVCVLVFVVVCILLK